MSEQQSAPSGKTSHHRHHFELFEVHRRVHTSERANPGTAHTRVSQWRQSLIQGPVWHRSQPSTLPAKAFTEASWSTATCAQLFFLAASDARAAKLFSASARSALSRLLRMGQTPNCLPSPWSRP